MGPISNEVKSRIASKLGKDVKKFLEKAGFYLLQAPEVTEKEGRFFIDIFIDEPRQLIGERGKNLSAFQHLVRLIIRKKYDDEIIVDIDINGYKRKRSEFLRDMALSVRRRAMLRKRDIEMEPMNAFDRRVIHSSLSQYDDIETESTGEGFSRRVVVKIKK